nr:HAMP domain-containing sensor histidine kinase [Ruegeria atlantica]
MKSNASAIAHDLKTPLSRLQIALHEIMEKTAMGQDPGSTIDAALSEAESLNTIFDTMLRISMIEADLSKDCMRRVDLQSLVEQVADFMRPVAEERNQSLVADATPVTVMADASMLQQSLVNLVTNASAHAGVGAKITIRATSDADGPTLSVRDTGPGIPAGDIDRVLQPFIRLDAARTTPGSGLGLALVKAVADRHNVILSLEDAKPGLRVCMRFPNFKNL